MLWRFTAYLWLLFVAPRWRRNDLVIGVFAVGALVEFVQAATGRTGSFTDLAADAAGIAVAVLPSIVDRLRHQTRERPYARVGDLARLDRRRSRTQSSTSPGSLMIWRKTLQDEP